MRFEKLMKLKDDQSHGLALMGFGSTGVCILRSLPWSSIHAKKRCNGKRALLIAGF